MNQKRIQTSERLIAGIVAFIASVFTVSFLGLIAWVMAPSAITVATAKSCALYGLGISFFLALAGAAFGAEKTAYLFGMIWGTNKFSEKATAIYLGAIILLCFLAIYLEFS